MFEGSNGISQLFRLAYFALIAALCKRRVMQKRYFSKAGIGLETCETNREPSRGKQAHLRLAAHDKMQSDRAPR
jgi:hypothetical protein